MPTDQEFFLMQQDRMRVINEDNARFAKLEESAKKLEKTIEEIEISSNAQIHVNRLFQNQLDIRQQEIKDLEIRLKKEETKIIPYSVPSAWTEPYPFKKTTIQPKPEIKPIKNSPSTEDYLNHRKGEWFNWWK